MIDSVILFRGVCACVCVQPCDWTRKCFIFLINSKTSYSCVTDVFGRQKKACEWNVRIDKAIIYLLKRICGHRVHKVDWAHIQNQYVMVCLQLHRGGRGSSVAFTWILLQTTSHCLIVRNKSDTWLQLPVKQDIGRAVRLDSFSLQPFLFCTFLPKVMHSCPDVEHMPHPLPSTFHRAHVRLFPPVWSLRGPAQSWQSKLDCSRKQ